MKAYCKAYSLSQLRAFPEWGSLADRSVDSTVDDDAYAFVCDDLTVVLDPINETEVLIDTITPEWETFCAQTLAFAVPEDLRVMLDTSSASQ